MGYIASRQPDARFVAMSNDKGYGPMLEHAGELGFSARQVGFGAPKAAAKTDPLFSLASAKPVAKKAPAVKKVATKTSPAATSVAVSGAGKSKAAANPAVKKVTSASRVASAKPAPKAAGASGSANSVSRKRVKGLAHVAARLKKTESKPALQAGLLALIKSLLGKKSEDLAIQSVLSQLICGGKVSIDEKGAVKYSL